LRRPLLLLATATHTHATVVGFLSTMPSKVMTSAFVTLRRHSVWKVKLGGVKKAEWKATLVYRKLSMVKHQGWHITTTNKKKEVVIAVVVTGSMRL
jgi:hypothetical protein